MKKLIGVLCILLCVQFTQAQTTSFTTHSQRGYWVNNKWVWEDSKDVRIKVVMLNKLVTFYNEANTKLIMTGDPKKIETDESVVFKYNAIDRKENCQFKIVHWKKDDQVQLYIVYSAEQFAFTLE